jgi:hypothetical protein
MGAGTRLTPICVFDLHTISDVGCHVSYTAREGDQDNHEPAVSRIEKGLTELRLGLSLRAEFPGLWQTLVGAGDDPNPRTVFVPLLPDRFPYFAAGGGKTLTITAECEAYAVYHAGISEAFVRIGNPILAAGGYRLTLARTDPTKAVDAVVRDVILICSYGASLPSRPS